MKLSNYQGLFGKPVVRFLRALPSNVSTYRSVSVQGTTQQFGHMIPFWLKRMNFWQVLYFYPSDDSPGELAVLFQRAFIACRD